ncbi:MAG: hypothetical protein J6M53_08875 [Bacteroidaceae bacterium]|nr:hypothetical protein [Bacteroidaceae bacterium]
MVIDAKLIVHGTPLGHDTWNARPDEKTYIEGFYSNSRARGTYLRIETRGGAEPVVYYHYLVYATDGQKVIEQKGRTSDAHYVGLTLRLEGGFSDDVQGVYRLLESVFETRIAGKLLERTPSALKYRVATLADGCNGALKEAENYMMSLINSGFIRLSGLPAGTSSTPNGTAVESNLYEAGVEALAHNVLKGTALLLSPHFTTKRERAAGKAAQEAAARMQADCAQKVQQAQQAETKASEKAQRLESELSRTKKEKDDLQRQLQTRTPKGSVGDRIDEVKRELVKLTASVQALQQKADGQSPVVKNSYSLHNSNSGSEKKYSLQSCLVSLFAVLLLLALIFGGGYLLRSCIGCSSDKALADTTQVAERTGDAGLQNDSTTTTGNEAVDDSKWEEAKEVDGKVLDIKSYQGGELHINETYTVSAKEKGSSLVWKVSGGKLESTNNDAAVFAPSGSEVVIYCEINGKAYKRTLKAKQKE